MPEPYSWVIQLGASGVLLLVLYLLVRTGDIRTKWEATAWEQRAKRAEDQVDRLIPAIEQTNDAVTALVSQNKDMLAAVQRMLDRVERVDLRSERGG